MDSQNIMLPESEQVYMEHAEGLADDMNLRLLCDMPLHGSDTILWVESITVTGITYPPQINKKPQKKKFGIGRLKEAAAGFFRNLFRHYGR
jgi:hypothetical protein